MTKEDRRQLVHFTMTGFAVLLAWLPQWGYFALASAAFALLWIVFPLTGVDASLRREGEPWIDGVKLYPVAVIALLLIFPLPEAAAAWGVMGVGDVASNVFGRRFGKPGFLGRRDRSLVGTLAFVATAWPAAWALCRVVSPDGASRPVAALAAAAAGAVAELVPWPLRLADNLPIALAAGAAMHFA